MICAAQLLRKIELPGTVLVISDMEFDMAVSGNGKRTLFDTIGRRFAAHGYRMPKLVFWNVNSRTNVIPVREIFAKAASQISNLALQFRVCGSDTNSQLKNQHISVIFQPYLHAEAP